MISRTIIVTVDDSRWPRLTISVYPECVVERGEMVSSAPPVERVSWYDTAITNLELPVLNVVRAAIRDIIQRRKEVTDGTRQQGPESDARVQTRDAPLRIQERPEGEKPEASRRDRPQRTTKGKAQTKVGRR